MTTKCLNQIRKMVHKTVIAVTLSIYIYQCHICIVMFSSLMSTLLDKFQCITNHRVTRFLFCTVLWLCDVSYCDDSNTFPSNLVHSGTNLNRGEKQSYASVVSDFFFKSFTAVKGNGVDPRYCPGVFMRITFLC